VLLFKDNPYQQSVYLTSANSLSAAVYRAFNGVTSYFHLRDINESLQERNAALEMELIELRQEMAEQELLSPDSLHQPALKQYTFVMAHVISNSIAQPNNYITIDRGSNDGVKPEMGVIDQNGVVGIVNVVGPHAARVISLLNPHMRLSCKLKNSGFFGSMVWDGKDSRFAVLEELPKHLTFHKGDTIVTSGYSAVFPEGIIVGTVDGLARGMSDSFMSLRIRLTTNFSQLSNVRVITNSMNAQIDALRRAEEGIDTVAGIQTRPEIKPEIVDVVPAEQPAKKKTQPSVPTAQPVQPVPSEPEPETNDQP
jgi:rod shape-determining protein MreC